MIDKFGKNILTLFGIGYFKYAPGTAASIVTCLFWLILFSLGIWNFVIIVSLYFVLLIYSIILIDKLSKKFSEIDAKEIVIDEFLGMSLALFPFYAYYAENGRYFQYNYFDEFFIYAIGCFILFRLCDIQKPYPINLIDKKLKNGLGVVLDDLVAAVFASFLSWVIIINLYNIF